MKKIKNKYSIRRKTIKEIIRKNTKFPEDIIDLIGNYLPEGVSLYKEDLIEKWESTCQDYIKLKVCYKYIGDDHDGYCSGSEMHGECTKYFYKNIIIKENTFNEDMFKSNGELRKEYLKILNGKHKGCTSKGSGYCDGFYQTYTATSAKKISTTEDDPFCSLWINDSFSLGYYMGYSDRSFFNRFEMYNRFYDDGGPTCYKFYLR